MSIKHKKKPCKPIGKAAASDYGCGKEAYKRTYGLCDTCYQQWLYNTPEGKDKQRQALPKCGECGERFAPYNNNSLQKFCMQTPECIKAQLNHNHNQELKKADADKRKHDVDSLTVDGYRKKYIQPLINHIARLIDHNQPCIASKVTKGKFAGGHYHAVGHNRTLAYNLHNIHIQAFHSNGPQGGQHIQYRHGLIEVYSREYSEYIDETLMQCPTLHLTKQDLIDVKPRLQAIRTRLTKLGHTYTPDERIRLRNALNDEIGIYKGRFAVFTT